jgi:hypothetical protein
MVETFFEVDRGVKKAAQRAAGVLSVPACSESRPGSETPSKTT